MTASEPILETERLLLRQPCIEDADAYVAFYQSERAKYVGGPLNLRRSWYAFYTEIGHWGLRGYGTFAAREKATGDLIGMIGPFFPHTWPETEIGWTLFEGHEGKGLAHEAAVAARAYAYGTLGWATAVSYIDPDNARSIALAERMGAVVDPNAEGMDPDDLVYRHPAPETLS